MGQNEAILNRLSECSQENDSKKEYDAVADTLTEILFDVNDLAKFHQINMTGFEKMIKKHDRYTKQDLRTLFWHQWQPLWPIDKLSIQFDILIVKISELHDLCRLHGHPRSQLNAYSMGGDQIEFERATAKFWIHPDNITEVKSIILFHLPVHVFNKKKKLEASDMAVSSVYFDNPQFDLYTERLERYEAAEAIRLRWYGPHKDENDNIFVERKTHKAPWREGKSVKDRFRLKEGLVNSFLSSEYTADHLAEDIRHDMKKKQTKLESIIQENHFVASGIQKSVKERQLKPTCRVFYNRTAFQLPGDQRLRISLDCNLTFIREDGCDSNWKRTDIDIDFPFRSIPEKDILRFPYAILETKLQTHLGQECPAWLDNLIESHLVHEVPRFSKYLHGASILFKDHIPTVPYWLPQCNIEIRRPPITNIGLSRSMSFKPLVNGHHRTSLLMMYDRELNGYNTTQEKKKKNTSLFNTSRFRTISNSLLKRESNQEETKNEDMNHLSLNLMDPHNDLKEGKKTVLPSRSTNGSRLGKRTEPKTFFANERTFISWLQFCALLLSVALGLLNHGDRISRIIGAVFILISSALSFYALGRFQYRSWQLRTHRQITRYDDIWGPTVLCIILVIALVINFYLRLESLSPEYHEAPRPTSSESKSFDN
ncbi:VTC domain-containing protein [Cokeromyces recurvatus]|uniref:VTC domain-containing protein n=1 Tax=Cokeromyces recurvatus TaxID=90255 RepID=UPI00221EA277|nr:VTC domain-containing protein [Cokeromyces recurvatus]KAI7904520.1 VTC domain-containing protein [Cokeromyces recurvatus]